MIREDSYEDEQTRYSREQEGLVTMGINGLLL